MKKRTVNLLILVLPLVVFFGTPARAQAKQDDGVDIEALHWSSRLGYRAWQVRESIPVIDRVVLVPDEATYLDEIAKWSPSGHWPVLLEDDHLAQLFIRRFGPAELVRRESIGALPADDLVRRRRLEDTVRRVWGGVDDTQSLRDVYAARGHVPAGVVLTSASDPSRTAAVALAAGRGQMLGWLDGQYGRPNTTMPGADLQAIDAHIRDQLNLFAYDWDELGDDIDAITICRSMSGRVQISQPANAMTAITDLLGRGEGGARYAFVGWIFGDETRAAYMAMCSLFLPREKFWLFNTYPDQAEWRAYGMTDAAVGLSEIGFEVRSAQGSRATEAAWLRLLPGGVGGDVLLMNSKGNADYFELADSRCFPNDVPLLDEPLIVHMIHSWSLRSPDSQGTVGAKWLSHGAYAYVGSIQEPFLQAFNPPGLISQRVRGRIPFLVACRQWEGRPWKINTIGDPLMICGPGRTRVGQRARYGTNVRDHLRELLEATKTDRSGDVYAEAVREAILLGQEKIAVDVAVIADRNGHSGKVAEPLLPVLFRQKRSREFMQAWPHLPEPDWRDKDMLWHLMLPELNANPDPDVLGAMVANLREPLTHSDLQRIGPHLVRAFGQAYTRNIIQREADRTTNRTNDRKLRALLRSLR